MRACCAVDVQICVRDPSLMTGKEIRQDEYEATAQGRAEVDGAFQWAAPGDDMPTYYLAGNPAMQQLDAACRLRARVAVAQILAGWGI